MPACMMPADPNILSTMETERFKISQSSKRFMKIAVAAVLSRCTLLVFAALPPGPGPFGTNLLSQPVVGALRGKSRNGWRKGKLCTIDDPALNNTNATLALQAAINVCGDLVEGGTVLVKSGLKLYVAALWLRSNLTLYIESGSTLIGLANGYGPRLGAMAEKNINVTDAFWTYTRRKSIMRWAHAGILNGGYCLEMKQPLVGWDDCAKWHKLENVVIEGGGLIDGNAEGWTRRPSQDLSIDKYLAIGEMLTDIRPMLLDLLWIKGLTIRNLHFRRSGFWTVHPTFCDNVKIENLKIDVDGWNTDGIDPDSCWNVYIANNDIASGDDCIALKAGRNWSGRYVNISTRNILIENNIFRRGHGVSIGSETSAWILDVKINKSVYTGPVDFAFRIKSMQGRGGGVRNISFSNAYGKVTSVVSIGIALDFNLTIINHTATPEFHDIFVDNISFVNVRRERVRARLDAWELRTKRDGDEHLFFYDTINFGVGSHMRTYPRTVIQPDFKQHADEAHVSSLECIGVSESHISGIHFSRVQVEAEQKVLPLASTCSYCNGSVDNDSNGYLPCFVDPMPFYRQKHNSEWKRLKKKIRRSTSTEESPT